MASCGEGPVRVPLCLDFDELEELALEELPFNILEILLIVAYDSLPVLKIVFSSPALIF